MSVHYLMRQCEAGWAVGATDGELWAPVHVTLSLDPPLENHDQ